MTPLEFELERASLFETTRPLLALTKGKRSKRQLLETLYGGLFTLPTQLMKPNYLEIPHRRSTTVFFGNLPKFHTAMF